MGHLQIDITPLRGCLAVVYHLSLLVFSYLPLAECGSGELNCLLCSKHKKSKGGKNVFIGATKEIALMKTIDSEVCDLCRKTRTLFLKRQIAFEFFKHSCSVL